MTRRLVTLLAVLTLALVACGDDDTTASTTTTGGGANGDATIVIEDFAFNAPATVASGTTITVQNRDGTTHTWTATDGAFDSGNISGGGSFQTTLDTPGVYAFSCQIHPNMQGTITVTG